MIHAHMIKFTFFKSNRVHGKSCIAQRVQETLAHCTSFDKDWEKGMFMLM